MQKKAPHFAGTLSNLALTINAPVNRFFTSGARFKSQLP
jgi:hypothetical protein